MAEISNEEFLRETQKAVERMREMNSKSKFDRSVHKMPPAPPFVRLNRTPAYQRPNEQRKPESMREGSRNKKTKQPDSGLIGSVLNSLGLNSGSVNILGSDPDLFLILGIIMLLSSEKGDKMLIAALLYILF